MKCLSYKKKSINFQNNVDIGIRSQSSCTLRARLTRNLKRKIQLNTLYDTS